MQPAEIFQCYRLERRHQTYTGYKLDVLPHLSRHSAEIDGAGGFVVFANLDPERIGPAIDSEITFFRQLRQDFEWKVYDFDTPADLRQLLLDRGFEQGDEEAFLVLEPGNWKRTPRQPGAFTIERISDPDQLRDFVAAEQAIWPGDLSWHLQKYARELERSPSSVSIYCAYVGRQPVGTGRISFPAKSSFAELNGGGVIASMRGRGIFTALLSRRIEEAKSRGYPWVAVDAAPMSRPILLRKGFQHVCWTYPMNRRVHPHASARDAGAQP